MTNGMRKRIRRRVLPSHQLYVSERFGSIAIEREPNEKSRTRYGTTNRRPSVSHRFFDSKLQPAVSAIQSLFKSAVRVSFVYIILEVCYAVLSFTYLKQTRDR